MAALHPDHPRWQMHQQANARFGTFADHTLAMHYGSALSEYEAVRQRVGLFDVSHMGRLLLKGKDAGLLIDTLFTGDVSQLPVGKAKYGLFCAQDGGIVDDVIVARESEQQWLCCVNAARIAVDRLHIQTCIADHAYQVMLFDMTPSTAQFALQGPKTWQVWQQFCSSLLNPLPPFSCWRGEINPFGEIAISTTGYTGEIGLELTCAEQVACDVWDKLLQVGQAVGIQPCGLVARDMLRLEMYYPLYGVDIDHTLTPWQADLARFVRINKKHAFVGQAALLVKQEQHTYQRLALRLQGKGIPRSGYPVQYESQQVGQISSGGYSPALQTGIAMAMVQRSFAQSGQALAVLIRDKAIAAQVITPPFYRQKGLS